MKVRPSFHRCARGFTLIELVIGSALMAIILVSAYACLSACLAGRKEIEPRVEVLQNARVAMALLSADLRAACVLAPNEEFVGMQRKLGDIDADNLDFATHHYTPRRPREADYCQVSYFVDVDQQTGQYALWRRRHPAIGLDPLSGGSREEIATGLHGLRIEYYDGWDWYDDWGNPEEREKQQFSLKDHPNATGLPEAVRITMSFDAAPTTQTNKTASVAVATDQEKAAPVMVFQTVVRLNLASISQGGSASENSGESTSEGTGQSAMPQTGGER